MVVFVIVVDPNITLRCTKAIAKEGSAKRVVISYARSSINAGIIATSDEVNCIENVMTDLDELARTRSCDANLRFSALFTMVTWSTDIFDIEAATVSRNASSAGASKSDGARPCSSRSVKKENTKTDSIQAADALGA